ncbi:MAG: TonB-dependent receptor [Bacteroidota bacterium]|nr:TonB-dependent receptor [Bacteroidota bacterium]
MKFIILIAVFFPVLAFSQSTLHGLVRDSSSHKLLEGATVTLRRMDGTPLRATVSNRGGYYFRRILPGEYQISFSFSGYNPQRVQIGVKDSVLLIQVPDAQLSIRGTQLMQIVIRATIPPVISRSDTLVYNAGAFRTRPNASVEDLLRKLPGVVVDDQGNVLVNGQKVDKFYIDGKEIPVNDPRAITQNLTSDMISDIETFDRQSSESKFSGIPDNDGKKSINFKLKKRFQNLLAGKAVAGHELSGTEGDRYGAAGHAFLFNRKDKVIFSADRNNSSDIIGFQSRPFVPQGISSHTRASLNGMMELAGGLKLNEGYGFDHSSTRTGNTTSRETFLTDSSLFNTAQNSATSISTNHDFNGNLYLYPNPSTEIQLTPSLNLSNNDDQSSTTQSVRVTKGAGSYTSGTSGTITGNHTQNATAGGTLGFRHRFNKQGESISLNLSTSGSSSKGNGSLLSTSYGLDSAGDKKPLLDLNQQNTQQSGNFHINTSAVFTYPLKKGLIADFRYSFDQGNQQRSKFTYNFDSASGKFDQVDTLTTNDFRSLLATHRFGAGLNQVRGKLRYHAGFAMEYSYQASRNSAFSSLNLSQKGVNVFPTAGIIFVPGRQNQLQLDYQGSTTQATIDQMQPLPDYSNPLLIHVGNPGLRPEFDHHVALSYRHFSRDHLRSLIISSNFALAQNQFTPATTILPSGVQQLEYVNTNGNYNSDASVSYDFPFDRGRRGNCRLSSELNYGHQLSVLNGADAKTLTLGLRPGVSFSYIPWSRALVECSANLIYNSSDYSYTAHKIDQLSSAYKLGVSLQLPFDLLINSDLDIDVTGPESSLPGYTQYLWNAALSRKLFKGRSDLRLGAYDLLNSSKGFSETAGTNYLESNRALVTGRMAYLTFGWSFKK